ncbi:MAG: DUF192 domain-containing protein [Povalibacter sp.]
MRHIRIATSSGIALATRVSVASSFRARLIGLLSRASLEPDEGLWLEPGGSVHTLGMRFPIDVVFLSDELKVLKVTSSLPPRRFAFAPRRTRYVLELTAGHAARCGIEVGTELVAGGLQ